MVSQALHRAYGASAHRRWAAMVAVAGIALSMFLPTVVQCIGSSTERPPWASPIPLRLASSTTSSGAIGSGAPAPPSFLRPHTTPISADRPLFSGHYYAGAVYNGTNSTSTALAVELGVPQDVPQKSDFYYVILSAWDSGGSYDQIGFTNDYGAWGVTYSTTTPCAGSYSYQTDAYNLTAGTTYQFAMSIASGRVTFTVAPVGGSTVWSVGTTTGGGQFVLAQDYTCDGSSSLDYTDYEEVYQTAAPEPPYEFLFANNTEDGSLVGAWATFTGSAPKAIVESITSTGVAIENEPYALVARAGIVGEVSPSAQSLSTNVSLLALHGTSTVVLAASAAIPGASVSLSSGSGTVPFTVGVLLDLSGSTPSGDYRIELNATSTGGIDSRFAVPVHLVGALHATPVQIAPHAVDVGHEVTLTETVSGGSGGFGYLWAGLPTNCSGISATIQCVPVGAGNDSISVTVNDSFGAVASSSITVLTVSPVLALSGTVSTRTIDLGQSVTLRVEVSGGSGGVILSWKESAPATCAMSGRNVSCVPEEVGRINISVSGTDSNGVRDSLLPVSIEVLADPTVTATALPTAVDLGGSVLLNASIAGGLAPFSFSWVDLPGNCTDPTRSTVTCRTNLSDLFPIIAIAIDALGFSSTSSPLLLEVDPAPTISLSSSSSSLLAGGGLSMVATATGGRSPYTFRWSGLPPGCASPDGADLSCNPTSAGTYSVSVVLDDAAGENASAALTITVQPSFLGLPASEGLALTGGGIVLVAAVSASAVLLVRRRRGPPARPRK